LRQAEKRLEITSRLVEEDARGKLTGVSARGRTIEQAAVIFGMTEEEFVKEFETGFKGVTWEQFAERAAIVQLDEVERAIWAGAKSGDVRFVQLLIITGRLPSWVPGSELPAFSSPRSVSGSQQVSVAEDLSRMSNEDLERKRKALQQVIDRPSLEEKLLAEPRSTLEMQDTTEIPEGWVKAADGQLVAKGCEGLHVVVQEEKRDRA
jgi:hypothetical protein